MTKTTEIICAVERAGFFWWGNYFENREGAKSFLVGIRTRPDRNTIVLSHKTLLCDAVNDAFEQLKETTEFK